MRLRNQLLMIVAIWLVSVVGVNCQEIKYDSIPGTNFSKYKKYKWQRAEKANYSDASVDDMMTRAIDAELSAKGFVRTNGDDADLYFVYQLAILQDVEWSTFTNQIHWHGGANTLAGFRGATTNSTEMIRKGWLIIDAYDVGTKDLVWEASATKALSKSPSPQKMEKNAKKVMSKIFKNFPPETRSK
jgi:hypothetical protein